MAEKYKLQLLNNENKPKTTIFTNKPEIAIGSGLQTDLRLQQPSVEDNHLQVYFDQMRLRVFGNNVFLNENPLDKNGIYSFQFGDLIRINNHKFAFNLTEPTDFVDENKIIRHPTLELANERARIPGMSDTESRDASGADERGSTSTADPTDEGLVSAAVGKATSTESPPPLTEEDILNDSGRLKRVLESKVDTLDEEIQKSVEHPVRDTPLIPSLSKTQRKDLGEAVIEKDILRTAERVIDEKMKYEHFVIENSLDSLKRDVKDNIKEELKDDLRGEFISDVMEDVREEVKDVLKEGVVKDAIIADVISEIRTTEPQKAEKEVPELKALPKEEASEEKPPAGGGLELVPVEEAEEEKDVKALPGREIKKPRGTPEKRQEEAKEDRGRAKKSESAKSSPRRAKAVEKKEPKQRKAAVSSAGTPRKKRGSAVAEPEPATPKRRKSALPKPE
jgi:hypothetical protein